jgi:hypothetical protein
MLGTLASAAHRPSSSSSIEGTHLSPDGKTAAFAGEVGNGVDGRPFGMEIEKKHENKGPCARQKIPLPLPQPA